MLRSLLISALFMVGCSSTPKATPPPAVAPAPVVLTAPTTVEEAVAHTGFRTEANVARDRYRHPVETLNFFGLKPDMTVVEITPGSGWYQEILAPLLAAKGHYIAAMPPASLGEANGGTAKVRDWQKAHPEAKVADVDLNPPAELAPAGSVDMVLTFRNVHNWMKAGNAKDYFRAFHKALKKGGVLGVVEHRANPKSKSDPKALSGYVKEKDLIAMAKAAGFKLDKTSDMNANPKDTKDYPGGVWTLPPVLSQKEKDREKYLEIGESDRMTLRFIKR